MIFRRDRPFVGYRCRIRFKPAVGVMIASFFSLASRSSRAEPVGKADRGMVGPLRLAMQAIFLIRPNSYFFGVE
jgi:hypothetical protein